MESALGQRRALVACLQPRSGLRVALAVPGVRWREFVAGAGMEQGNLSSRYRRPVEGRCCVDAGSLFVNRSSMASPPAVTGSAFVGYRFPSDVILLAVRWYLRYNLSYRDLEELLAERGVEVDHVTLFRWV